jgi:hypothetical protein
MILDVTRDVGPFLGVCTIAIAGCTCFFAINQPEAGSAFGDFDGVAGVLAPLLTVVLAMLGEFEIDNYTKKTAVAMFLLFAFFVVVLMLNLLIAIMGDAYSKVKESELVEGLHARAQLIVEHERLFPWRQTYCRYLHVAEAVAEDESQATWEGLGGRIKQMRREVMTGQADLEAKLETKLEVSQAKLEAMVDQIEAKLGRVEAGQAKVEGLLEKLVAQSLQNSV